MKQRICLEKLCSQDFEQYYTLVGNEKVMAMITERALSRDEALEKFNHFLNNNELHPSFGTFKIFEAASKELLGLAKLEIKKLKRNEAELGYLLQPEFWGKGFGNEIAEVLLEVALADPQLTRVFAITDPQNIASRKILLRNGFVSEELGEIDGLPSEIFGRKME
ncbi:MAG: N-acetyltransferase [Bacteroidia bacterium]|nr:MAG: N-acetyltransferase [Bacteroidia bacterium]